MITHESPSSHWRVPGHKAVWSVRAALVAAVLGLVLVAGAARLDASQPPTGQGGFVPVENLPAQEQLPAAPLVMAAYAVAWVAVFLYLWSIWQRLGRVERDIAEVSRRIDAGSRR